MVSRMRSLFFPTFNVRKRFTSFPVRHSARRFLSKTTVNASEESARSNLYRINSKLPKFLQQYTSGLANAPFSHITSFLILHEITAIVPLFGFAGLFYYTEWLPASVTEWKWAAEGMVRFERYARRKGWISSEEGKHIEHQVVGESVQGGAFGWNQGGNRVLIAFATAWALTKALLPLRLALSVWATPWFAMTTLVPLTRVFSRSSRVTSSSTFISTSNQPVSRLSQAGGTNAIGGGVTSSRP